uniref:Apple domain-containing protein n=1 Tax=Macrostomum lignano TaxID=282301 RepID=A0A1I8IMG2_9PLAT
HTHAADLAIVKLGQQQSALEPLPRLARSIVRPELIDKLCFSAAANSAAAESQQPVEGNPSAAPEANGESGNAAGGSPNEQQSSELQAAQQQPDAPSRTELLTFLLLLFVYSHPADCLAVTFVKESNLCLKNSTPAAVAAVPPAANSTNATFRRISGIADVRVCAVECAAAGSLRCSVFQLVPGSEQGSSSPGDCLLGSSCDLANQWSYNNNYSNGECLTQVLDDRLSCDALLASPMIYSANNAATSTGRFGYLQHFSLTSSSGCFSITAWGAKGGSADGGAGGRGAIISARFALPAANGLLTQLTLVLGQAGTSNNCGGGGGGGTFVYFRRNNTGNDAADWKLLLVAGGGGGAGAGSSGNSAGLSFSRSGAGTGGGASSIPSCGGGGAGWSGSGADCDASTKQGFGGSSGRANGWAGGASSATGVGGFGGGGGAGDGNGNSGGGGGGGGFAGGRGGTSSGGSGSAGSNFAALEAKGVTVSSNVQTSGGRVKIELLGTASSDLCA